MQVPWKEKNQHGQEAGAAACGSKCLKQGMKILWGILRGVLSGSQDTKKSTNILGSSPGGVWGCSLKSQLPQGGGREVLKSLFLLFSCAAAAPTIQSLPSEKGWDEHPACQKVSVPIPNPISAPVLLFVPPWSRQHLQHLTGSPQKLPLAQQPGKPCKGWH